jgi:hypothetical protein
MVRKERRRKRSEDVLEALELQLEACREQAGLEAMVLGDGDGLCLAWAGQDASCKEVAARMALVNQKIENFEGVVLSPERRWNVRMRRFEAEGSDLYVCAIGGGGEKRAHQVHRSIGGVSRILAAA